MKGFTYILKRNFNNKFYGLKGGNCEKLISINNFGEIVEKKHFALDVEFSNSSSTTWATKSVTLTEYGIYEIIDKYTGYYKFDENGFNEIDEKKALDSLKLIQMEQPINPDIDIKNTIEYDFAVSFVGKINNDLLYKIKNIEGSRFDDKNNCWVIPKDKKIELENLDLLKRWVDEIIKVKEDSAKGLINIEGSEKQIQWGNTIRRNMLDGILQLLNDLEKVNIDGIESFKIKVKEILEEIKKQNKARWFIDRRDRVRKNKDRNIQEIKLENFIDENDINLYENIKNIITTMK